MSQSTSPPRGMCLLNYRNRLAFFMHGIILQEQYSTKYMFTEAVYFYSRNISKLF